MDTSDRCAACDQSLTGAYCAACGEPRPQPDHETLSAVLREQLQEVTSADGKLWRSLRLLFSPGTLTVEYFSGRRTRYVRPIRLFLILNLALFFVLGFLQLNPLKGELATQQGVVGERGAAALQRAQEAWGGDPALFEALFDQKAGTLSSTLIILLIPACGLLFAVVFRWQTGARTLVFATHALTAMVAFYLALIGLAMVIVLGFAVMGVDVAALESKLNLSLVIVVVLVVGAYLAVGARRVYGLSTARAGLGAVAITLGGIPALLMAYRVLLFWLTLWTLDLPKV